MLQRLLRHSLQKPHSRPNLPSPPTLEWKRYRWVTLFQPGFCVPAASLQQAELGEVCHGPPSSLKEMGSVASPSPASGHLAAPRSAACSPRTEPASTWLEDAAVWSSSSSTAGSMEARSPAGGTSWKHRVAKDTQRAVIAETSNPSLSNFQDLQAARPLALGAVGTLEKRWVQTWW